LPLRQAFDAKIFAHAKLRLLSRRALRTRLRCVCVACARACAERARAGALLRARPHKYRCCAQFALAHANATLCGGTEMYRTSIRL